MRPPAWVSVRSDGAFTRSNRRRRSTSYIVRNAGEGSTLATSDLLPERLLDDRGVATHDGSAGQKVRIDHRQSVGVIQGQTRDRPLARAQGQVLAIACALASTLRPARRTNFGLPVEPDVVSNRARSSNNGRPSGVALDMAQARVDGS